MPRKEPRFCWNCPWREPDSTPPRSRTPSAPPVCSITRRCRSNTSASVRYRISEVADRVHGSSPARTRRTTKIVIRPRQEIVNGGLREFLRINAELACTLFQPPGLFVVKVKGYGHVHTLLASPPKCRPPPGTSRANGKPTPFDTLACRSEPADAPGRGVKLSDQTRDSSILARSMMSKSPGVSRACCSPSSRRRRAASRPFRSAQRSARPSGEMLRDLPLSFFRGESSTVRSPLAASYCTSTGSLAPKTCSEAVSPIHQGASPHEMSSRETHRAHRSHAAATRLSRESDPLHPGREKQCGKHTDQEDGSETYDNRARSHSGLFPLRYRLKRHSKAITKQLLPSHLGLHPPRQLKTRFRLVALQHGDRPYSGQTQRWLARRRSSQRLPSSSSRRK